MPKPRFHRFEHDGKRFALDPETCFCFECDAISWDVLEYYPHTPINAILHALADRHDRKELDEVVSELEWLRATKAVLAPAKPEDVMKQFTGTPGVRRLTVCLPRKGSVEKKRRWFGQSGEDGAMVLSSTARDIGREAIGLLFARAQAQAELQIEFLEEGAIHNSELVADLCGQALKIAKLSQKTLSAAVRVTGIDPSDAPEALRGHGISVAMEFQDASKVLSHLRALDKAARALEKAGRAGLKRLAKLLQPSEEGVRGWIVVRPNHKSFGDVVAELDGMGFKHIELDLDGAYVANPELKPDDMLEGLSTSAVYYAEGLLKHRYFRLDPIATLFWHIYEGKPTPRTDPSGTNELAVGADGGIYPSWRFVGNESFRMGSLSEGTLDEERLAEFDNVGASATGVCRSCWARNLCGGGPSAVHHALTGSPRTPHEPWCEAQRAWMAAAVSAFNLLSSEGVNFTRVYGALTATGKLSLFSMLRAALRMSITMRPLEEADAEMLVKWENWNPASYFTLSERGLLAAAKYDREMDALHPVGDQQELVIIRKDGTPIGLVRLRSERYEGTAQGWIYMHQETVYAATEVRKGFRLLLEQTGKQQGLRRLVTFVADYEKPLQEFLEGVGFAREGTQREALFLHDARHDVHVYGLAIDQL